MCSISIDRCPPTTVVSLHISESIFRSQMTCWTYKKKKKTSQLKNHKKDLTKQTHNLQKWKLINCRQYTETQLGLLETVLCFKCLQSTSVAPGLQRVQLDTMQQKLQKPEYSYICNFYLLQDKVFHCTCVSSVYKNVSLCVYQSCKTEICLCVVVLLRILAASNDDHVARRDRRFKQRYKLCSYLTSSATVVL
jgi:hypothetical protein